MNNDELFKELWYDEKIWEKFVDYFQDEYPISVWKILNEYLEKETYLPNSEIKDIYSDFIRRKIEEKKNEKWVNYTTKKLYKLTGIHLYL